MTVSIERGSDEVKHNGVVIGRVSQLYPSKRWSFQYVNSAKETWYGNYKTKDAAASELYKSSLKLFLYLQSAFQLKIEK